MRKGTKTMTVFLTVLLLLVSLSGCTTVQQGQGSGEQAQQGQSEEGKFEGTLRWMHFKTGLDDGLNALSALYEEETGIKVVFDTAASDTYESTLVARMDTADAPSIFIVEDHLAAVEFADYCADLKGTVLDNWVSDESLKHYVDGKLCAVSEVIEGWGLIVNKTIFNQYFDSPNKTTEYTNLDEICTFEALKAVTEDMTKMKEELGIEGVWAVPSMSPGNDWRYANHLMAIPLFWEWGGNENIDLNGPSPDFEFKH